LEAPILAMLGQTVMEDWSASGDSKGRTRSEQEM